MYEIKLPVPKEDVLNLRKLGAAKEAFADIINNWITAKKDVCSSSFTDYQNKYSEALLAFKDGQKEMEKHVIPAALRDSHQYTYRCDYADRIMTVQVTCNCGCKKIRELGIPYREG